jgi:hypothetical protein
MRRDEDEDDDEIEEDFSDSRRRPRALFPSVVMVAGIVWIGFGALSLLGTLLTVIQAAGNRQAGGDASTAAVSIFCGGFIGISLLICGFQAVTGKGSDTALLFGAIVSILIGALYLLCGGFLAIGVGAFANNFGGGNNNPLANLFGAAAAIVIGIFLVFAVLLIGSGVLALAGRNAYRDWKEGSVSRYRRRTRRRDEEDEEDEDDDREERRDLR